MNILIPMAGEGSRFKAAGYTTPKPFLEIHPGITLTDVAINPFIGLGDFCFLIRQEHSEFFPTHHKIIVPGLTEGAACTLLLAKSIINNNKPLLIVNSDQIINFDQYAFRYLITHTSPDGVIFTFESTESKFSYVKLDKAGNVCETAEKKVISNQATCGAYYFRRGSDFVSCAEEMIAANDRINGEFYTAPVYNYLIRRGGLVKPFKVDEMICLGTPEDYERFKANSSQR